MAAQGEHQEHLRGPDADAFYLGQPFDDVEVGERRKLLEDQLSVTSVTGQVADIRSFLCGKAQFAHAGGAQGEDFRGRHLAAHRVQQAVQNNLGDLPAELLVDDGAYERVKSGFAKLDTIGANPFDNSGEYGIVFSEVLNRVFHVKQSSVGLRQAYCTGMRILTVVTLGSVLLAQDQLPSIKVDVDVVSILTSVRDKRGALVPSLQKEDFTILEDGKAQPIKYFTKETDLPLTIGMLVDVSGSQRNLIDIERSAASQFFRDVLRKKDLAFLISFGEETELLQDYTGSPGC